MIEIIGGRGTGKTVKMIKEVQRLNQEHGINDTVILVKTREDARRVSELADRLGYRGMPFPLTFDDIKMCKPTHYKKVVVDDIERVFQQAIQPWILEGFTLTNEENETNDT